ncbi:MAG: hypothetical protein AAGU19_14185 [Prolixibacteraceae bacterium]
MILRTGVSIKFKLVAPKVEKSLQESLLSLLTRQFIYGGGAVSLLTGSIDT